MILFGGIVPKIVLKLLRIFLVIYSGFVIILAANCLEVYDIKYVYCAPIPYFYYDEISEYYKMMIQLYNWFIVLSLLLADLILPCLSIYLTYLIRHVKLNRWKLVNSWKTVPTKVEIKMTKVLIVTSLFTSFCISSCLIELLRGTFVRLYMYCISDL